MPEAAIVTLSGRIVPGRVGLAADATIVTEGVGPIVAYAWVLQWLKTWLHALI